MTDDRRKGDRRMPPAVADFALQQLATTPMTVQDFTHDAENYGPALNEAGWTFINECPEKSTLLFNNIKTPLRAAILKYAERVKPTTAENYELLQAKVDEQAREIERLAFELDHCRGVATNRGLEIAALKAQSSGVVLDQYDAGLLNDFGGGNIEWWQDYIRAELERAHDFYQSQLARLNSSPASAGEIPFAGFDPNFCPGSNPENPQEPDEDEARHDAVKALHDVMQAVPCASLYSLAEAVLDAGYVKPVSAGGVDERAAVYMLKVRGMAWWREADKEAFDSAPDDRYEKLALYDRAALTASAPNHSEQVPHDLAMAMHQRDHYANRVFVLELGIGKIAADFIPSSDDEAPIALGEMRDALEALLAAAPSAGSQKEQG